MKKNYKDTLIRSILIALLAWSAAMPAPAAKKAKRPMKYRNVTEAATTLYESANSEIASGKYLLADTHLAEAYSQAVSVDNRDLLCKISLSKAVLCHSTGTDFTPALDEARHFAASADEKDFLQAVCTLYEADLKGAQADMEKLNSAEKMVAKDAYYLAYLFRIKANLYALQQDYMNGERYYLMAADLHTKECYLSEIGLDWYQISRMRSLIGKKKTALEALETAIKYDRDAENTTALGSDYFAKALVLTKNGATDAEKKEALENAKWAREIFTAGEYKAMADRCDLFIKGLDQ
ncbi:MAG: hypothetical protein KBS64_00870 [Treponema sp.]|nr:hypothetical protein [Candidatus Treponema equi]